MPGTAPCVRKDCISTSGSRTSCRVRSALTWRPITSRNVSPSRASSSDFGPSSPMLVPSPPLSLITHACPSAPNAAGRGSWASVGSSRTGSSSASGSMPDAPATSWS